MLNSESSHLCYISLISPIHSEYPLQASFPALLYLLCNCCSDNILLNLSHLPRPNSDEDLQTNPLSFRLHTEFCCTGLYLHLSHFLHLCLSLWSYRSGFFHHFPTQLCNILRSLMSDLFHLLQIHWFPDRTLHVQDPAQRLLSPWKLFWRHFPHRLQFRNRKTAVRLHLLRHRIYLYSLSLHRLL